MTRPLALDYDFKAECARLREFAEKQENWYVLGKTTVVPGDEPEYSFQTEFGFRVVFTITHAPEHKPQPFRHLSISVSGKDYPNPVAVYTIAHHLGFTGATVKDDVATEPGKWGMAVDDEEHCIVVQEPYDGA
jgi:hypothetical protein